MKMKLMALIVLSFLIIGCSQTYVLNKESQSDFMEQIQKKTRKKKVVIEGRDGKKYDAEEIWPLIDSTSWRDPTTNSYKTKSNSELKRIVISDHAKGAVEGLGFGILSGFAGGFVLGYAASSEHAYFGRAGSATVTGTALGALGGFLGLIVGSASGDNDIFLFGEHSLKPEYYLIRDVQILSETESTIEIIWQGNTVSLDKAEIMIEKTDNGVGIRIPVEIYKKKFR